MAILFVVLAIEQSPGQVYDPPAGGWTYTYNGAAAADGPAFTALDGTWDHDNGSDEWDGSAIGAGRPGGASALVDGETTYLRLQDTGDPRDYGMGDPGSIRKIFFGHDISAEGAGGDILDTGVTLSLRARIPTTGPFDDVHPDGGGGVGSWPAGGDGYEIHDGGKGIGIHQADGGTISFHLALSSTDNYSTNGLAMNALNGTSTSADVDVGEGTENVHPLADPTLWHEFWITIASGGSGTHQVTLYADGGLTGTTYDVTAGSGNDYSVSYLSMEVGSTGQQGAVDIDFMSWIAGVQPPTIDLVPGDANGDGEADLADLTILRGNYFEEDVDYADGDFNFDNIVDFLDYRIWTENRTDGPGSSSVPEPACLGLALIGAIAVFGIRRRR